MRLRSYAATAAVVFGLVSFEAAIGQNGGTAAAPSTKADSAGVGRIAVDAKLVMVPVVIFDKKGLVTTLKQGDFAVSVNGKAQAIRYFDRDTDVPLTVGLLVDTSRSQTSALPDEQKASQKFLESFLRPASPNRPTDKAFIMQFAHSAELLQDVTSSRPLLEAGLKQIGTLSPGSTDDSSTRSDADQDNVPGTPTTRSGNGGMGPYGRRSGYPGGGGAGPSGGSNQPRGGTVLYDAIFLASEEVLQHQNGRRALVLLTDGVDRHSKESLTEAIQAAQRAGTTVYAMYYRGEEHNFNDRRPGGYDGGYGGYGGYGRPGYPGGGGRPGSDGTYAEPDGKKILERICEETGGRFFEVKGKGSVDEIYAEIGEELRAQYRLGFTPSGEAEGSGFHPVEVTLTDPMLKKAEIQAPAGYYTGTAAVR